MARIPYVDPATASDHVRETLAQMPVQLNIFRVMAHAETNFQPLIRLGASILSQQKLDGRWREMAILRVAKLSGAPYEWVQHVPIALAVGVRHEQITALDSGRVDDPCFDDFEKLLLRFTDEVVRDVGASKETFEAMAEKVSTQEIVELVVAIGFYMTVARLMQTVEIDIEADAGTKVIDALASR